MSFPFILKYLLSVSHLAFESSKVLFTFSVVLYLSKFKTASSLLSSAEITKSKVIVSSGLIFIVLFNATTGSVRNSCLLENGIEFEINNLESDVTYYLAYRTGGMMNRTYYNESMSAANFATENVKITFEQNK